MNTVQAGWEVEEYYGDEPIADFAVVAVDGSRRVLEVYKTFHTDEQAEQYVADYADGHDSVFSPADREQTWIVSSGAIKSRLTILEIIESSDLN